MEVEECIKTRRTVRKYRNIPVQWDLIAKVVDAGRLAPSAGNLQNWKFIIVQDEGKRDKLAEACLHQLWMNTAPVHIVICSEPTVSERFYGARGDRLYSVQNCAVAAQNMLLRAHDLGLGACWIGAFDENSVSEIVNLPTKMEVRPQLIITLGYPDENPAEPSKYPIENVAYLDSWRGKIRDFPAYTGYYSQKWAKGANKGKAVLQEQGKNIANKAKEIKLKIKEKVKSKQKKQKEFKEFKEIYGLK